MMNRFDTDLDCSNKPPFDSSTFPSITSREEFDLLSYEQQLSAFEEAATEEEILLSEAPIPSVDSVIAVERDLYSTFGDKRFNGAAAYDFLFTRYKPLAVEDLAPPTLTAIACDSEGIPYTYTIPNSSTYYDTENKTITLPVYDARGRVVEFPLKNEFGKYVLSPAITAIDNKNDIIFFPLKDINNVPVSFPFKDAVNTLLIVPPKNQEHLFNVTEAYSNLDTASSNAKDLHSYQFAEFIYSLETAKEGKISFFYSNLEVPSQSATAPMFAAAVYNLTATNAELIDITSLNIDTLIRYYPDRAEHTYNHYKNLGGIAPYTVITPLTGRDIKSLIKNENTKLASYSILASPFWDHNTLIEEYYNTSSTTASRATHTSTLELIDKTDTHTANIGDLQTQINNLKATVNSLSTQLLDLSARYVATNNNVIYNSGVIDTLVSPIVWVNIWTPTAGFVSPGIPTPR